MLNLNFPRSNRLQKISLIIMVGALVLILIAIRGKQNITTKADIVNFTEAEDFVTSSGNFSVVSDPTASGGKYILLGQ